MYENAKDMDFIYTGEYGEKVFHEYHDVVNVRCLDVFLVRFTFSLWHLWTIRNQNISEYFGQENLFRRKPFGWIKILEDEVNHKY